MLYDQSEIDKMDSDKTKFEEIIDWLKNRFAWLAVLFFLLFGLFKLIKDFDSVYDIYLKHTVDEADSIVIQVSAEDRKDTILVTDSVTTMDLKINKERKSGKQIDVCLSINYLKYFEEKIAFPIDCQNANARQVEFETTGSIRPISRNNSIYTGGNLKLLVDGKLCSEIYSIKIASLPANTNNAVLNFISSALEEKIKSNSEIIAKELNKCLK